jgi:hypothetical protein
MKLRFNGCLLATIAIGVLIGAVFVSFQFGLVMGELRTYSRRREAESAALHEVLRSSPSFANLEIQSSCSGSVSVVGTVPDQASLDKLTRLVFEEVGKVTPVHHVERLVVEVRP